MPTITSLLGNIATYILNPLIILGFVVATIFLFYGIVRMIWGADGDDLDKSKKAVMYGVIGLFIMFSVFGIFTFDPHNFWYRLCRKIFLQLDQIYKKRRRSASERTSPLLLEELYRNRHGSCFS